MKALCGKFLVVMLLLSGSLVPFNVFGMNVASSGNEKKNEKKNLESFDDFKKSITFLKENSQKKIFSDDLKAQISRTIVWLEQGLDYKKYCAAYAKWAGSASWFARWIWEFNKKSKEYVSMNNAWKKVSWADAWRWRVQSWYKSHKTSCYKYGFEHKCTITQLNRAEKMGTIIKSLQNFNGKNTH